jgi:KipI family sensor histidine kinase inhibitor
VQVLRVGHRALLVEVADSAAARSLAGWVRTSRLAVREVVPAARTVLLDGVEDLAGAAAALESWQPSATAATAAAGALVEVPVRYDGPDLAFVAERWGTDEAGVVAFHTGLELVAAFCGFAPGFSYLEGLPRSHAVPRLETPRSRVPAGSVAVADTWCSVYPSASPGGWRIIGSTDATLWDPDRDPPALLPPGTRVSFRDASEGQP